jgi:hypothetical protein
VGSGAATGSTAESDMTVAAGILIPTDADFSENFIHSQFTVKVKTYELLITMPAVHSIPVSRSVTE